MRKAFFLIPIRRTWRELGVLVGTNPYPSSLLKRSELLEMVRIGPIYLFFVSYCTIKNEVNSEFSFCDGHTHVTPWKADFWCCDRENDLSQWAL